MELHHSSEQEAPKKVTKLFLNMPLVFGSSMKVSGGNAFNSTRLLIGRPNEVGRHHKPEQELIHIDIMVRLR